MTACPTCGNPVKIISDKEGTSYYEAVPATETVGAAAAVSQTFDCRPDKQWLIDAQDKEIAALKDGYEELDSILCCHPGETVLEAAARWREIVKWYADKGNYERVGRFCNAEIDAGDLARELLGKEK